MSKRKHGRGRTHVRQASGHGDLHHIIPRSRGGPDDPANLYFWYIIDASGVRMKDPLHEQKHDAWHTLVHNLLPEEAKVLTLQWRRKDGNLDLRYFQARKGKPNKRLIAWRLLFDDMAIDDVLEWIDREFIRKEWTGR